MAGKGKDMNPRNLYTRIIPSPLGPLTLTATDKGLFRIVLPRKDSPQEPPSEETPFFPFPEALSAIQGYLAGKTRRLQLPLDLRGTHFQKTIWTALTAIPYGETRTYGEIARGVGRPRASRAVGQACGANPLPLVIPCHRVLGKTGFGGFYSGLDHKKWLLRLEKKDPER